jgi:hypothetical protein
MSVWVGFNWVFHNKSSDRINEISGSVKGGGTSD